MNDRVPHSVTAMQASFAARRRARVSDRASVVRAAAAVAQTREQHFEQNRATMRALIARRDRRNGVGGPWYRWRRANPYTSLAVLWIFGVSLFFWLKTLTDPTLAPMTAPLRHMLDGISW